MAGARSRYYRGQRCCEGRAPEWDSLYEGGVGGMGGPLSDDEMAAISAVENYGGTFRSGSPPQLMPMEHTNLVDWNRPIFMSAADSWVAPFDKTLPRLSSFADLPSLPNPDVVPGNGLPHHQQTLAYQQRERAKGVPFTNFRIRYSEATGQHFVQTLWCRGCGPDPWEQFCRDLSQTFTEMVPYIRGIAMVCSYVPVFGTAVAFVINTTTSLVEGQSLDGAFLDGIGGALPGQPVSGMAFTAARALINGESIDRVGLETALAALPVDAKSRNLIGTAVEIAIQVAKGTDITTIALNQIREQLPESGRKAMDVARRVCDGENVGNILSTEAIEAAHKAVAEGEAAVNSFVAQAGFQEGLDLLPPQLQDGIKAGIAVGVIESKSKPFIGTFGSVPESNVAANETFLQKGQRLVAAGAKYNGRPISEILAGTSFSIAIDQFDALNRVWGKKTVRYKADGPCAPNERPLTDPWRRGFVIALGACDGLSERTAEQTAAYQTMAEAGGRDGFDAGQAVAWWRTKHDIAYHVFTATEVKASKASQILGLMRDEPPAAPAAPVVVDKAQADALDGTGDGVVRKDMRAVQIRHALGDDASRRGFNIAFGAAGDQTLPGPGKDRLRDALPVDERQGFATAVSYFLARNSNAALAAVGQAIAKANRDVSEARNGGGNGFFSLGFDIATGIYGDPVLGAQGITEPVPGPGQAGIRESLNDQAKMGFDASKKLHLGPPPLKRRKAEHTP
jgi:hypothetical protein